MSKTNFLTNSLLLPELVTYATICVSTAAVCHLPL